jgi:hypothetical protein
MIGELLADVESFVNSLRRWRAVNVNDQESKERAITLATRYFSGVRSQLVSTSGESDTLLEHDEHWQQLVRLAHGNNSRGTYVKLAGKLRKQLSEFKIATLSTPTRTVPDATANSGLSREEALLIATLEALVPSAAASYTQGLTDLQGPARSSYRGTAAEFRESLREILDHLAPDDDVVKQPGYKHEEGQKKPTMKQKTKFILQSRSRNKTQMESAVKMLGLIEEMSGEVLRAVYNRASVATHVHQSKAEVAKIKRYVDTVLFDLLEIGA